MFHYHTKVFDAVQFEGEEAQGYMNKMAELGYRVHSFEPNSTGALYVIFELIVGEGDSADLDEPEDAPAGIPMRG